MTPQQFADKVRAAAQSQPGAKDVVRGVLTAMGFKNIHEMIQIPPSRFDEVMTKIGDALRDMPEEPVFSAAAVRETGRTVHKYLFDVEDTVTLDLPKGASVLHVGQAPGEYAVDRLALWALVDPTKPTEGREFIVRGTGHYGIPDNACHIGTVIVQDMVWHVFDVTTHPHPGMIAMQARIDSRDTL